MQDTARGQREVLKERQKHVVRLVERHVLVRKRSHLATNTGCKRSRHIAKQKPQYASEQMQKTEEAERAANDQQLIFSSPFYFSFPFVLFAKPLLVL